MAFKFGPNSRTRLPQAAPANYGRATDHFSVQQELDWTAARANAQQMEAIAVDGVDLHYWKRSREGRFCTCQNKAGFRAEADPSDLSDPPAVRVRQATSILDGSKNPRLRVTNGPFGGTVIGELLEDETGNAFDQETGEKEQDIFEYITQPGDEAEDGLLVDQDDYLNNPDAGVVFGGEKSPCGICFKTGHVGGYQLLQGSRIVLDSTGEYPMDLDGYDINSDARPFEFTSANDPTNSVTWTVEIPKYFLKVCAALVRNNLTISRNAVLEFKPVTGGTWAALRLNSLDQYKGVGGKFLIRVRPASRVKDGTAVFTHVELVFQTAPWIKGQIAPLEKTTNFAIFQGMQTRIGTLVLPPTLPNVTFDDVLLDQKYGILWKINQVTDFMTASRQIMGWQVQAREIHPDEMTYLLKVTYVPYVELNYAGLERIQGQYLTTEDRF